MGSLTQALATAAKQSAADLASLLTAMLKSGATAVALEKNETTLVGVLRALSDQEFAPYVPRLRQALLTVANDWMTGDEQLNVAYAMLARSFPSPELASCVAQHLLSPRPLPTRTDLLIDAVSSQAQDPTVQRHCVDLLNDDRFTRYVFMLFFRLVRADASTIAMTVDRAIAVAQRHLDAGGQATYMVGFDRQMNLADLRNILADLTDEQSAQFFEHFLSHSVRYGLDDQWVPQPTTGVERYLDPHDGLGTTVIRDSQTRGHLAVRNPAILTALEFAHFQRNREEFLDEMEALGIPRRQMAA